MLGTLLEQIQAAGHVVHVIRTQGRTHPTAGAEGVDEERVVAALDVVQEEGGTGPLHDAVGDLGQVDRGRQSDGLACQRTRLACGFRKRLTSMTNKRRPDAASTCRARLWRNARCSSSEASRRSG